MNRSVSRANPEGAYVNFPSDPLRFIPSLPPEKFKSLLRFMFIPSHNLMKN